MNQPVWTFDTFRVRFNLIPGFLQFLHTGGYTIEAEADTLQGIQAATAEILQHPQQRLALAAAGSVTQEQAGAAHLAAQLCDILVGALQHFDLPTYAARQLCRSSASLAGGVSFSSCHRASPYFS